MIENLDLFSQWQVRGNCAQEGKRRHELGPEHLQRFADDFFPDPRANATDAKRQCAGCPVRMDCLRHALRHDIRDGVWGGLTEDEREPLHQQRERKIQQQRSA